ncbi:hypothetical protein WJX77_000189 [Trebouxia sp. C0004]
MELVVLRLLGQIQLSGQPGVLTVVEIERAHIVATNTSPYKLSSPVATAMASVVGIMQFLQDASLEIREQRQSSRACTTANSSCSPT